MRLNIIFLVGFMGCGKSTVAQSFNDICDTYDTDELIEKFTGQSISEIFERKGEKEFRLLENKILDNLLIDYVLNKRFMVVATGGGIVTERNNLSMLKQGTVIYLKNNFIDRLSISSENRPLLDNLSEENFYKLINERTPLYEESADITIEVNDKSICEIKREIINEYLRFMVGVRNK